MVAGAPSPESSAAEGELTETPSIREGVGWDGEDFVPTNLAWHNGAWEPTDASEGDVVNNETPLEKLPAVDRTLVLAPVLAFILLLCAGGFALMDALWTPTSAAAETSNLERAAQICFLASAAFVIVFVVVAIVRLTSRLARGRDRAED